MTTRREFLALSAAAPFVRPDFSVAQDAGDSGLVTGKPMPLKYEEIKGFLSKDQLAPHHGARYSGAIKSLTQIESELEGADRSKSNANYSPIRELKREQIHAMNSILLHELYFSGLSAKGEKPGEAAREMIEKRFATVDKGIEDFKAAAIAARGWAILSYHPVNRTLYNIVTDVHDVGPLVSGIPLVVIDCYEHAFYVDYKNKKADYVGTYPQFIDWSAVDARFRGLR